MTFKGILDDVSTWAGRHGLPVFFGDEYTRNVLANQITGDFVFVDVPGGIQTYSDLAPEPLGVSVLIQVLGTSHYLRDDTAEIEVLTGLSPLLLTLPSRQDVTTLAGLQMWLRGRIFTIVPNRGGK